MMVDLVLRGVANARHPQDVVHAFSEVLGPAWSIEVDPIIFASVDILIPAQDSSVPVHIPAVQVVAPHINLFF